VRLGETIMQLWLAGEETPDESTLGMRSVESFPTGVVPSASEVSGGVGQ